MCNASRLTSLACAIVAVAFIVAFLSGSTPIIALENPRVLEFELPTVDGKMVALERGAAAKFTVVCFLGTECPLAKLYGPRLVELNNRFGNEGVRFVGINSNQQDSLEDVARYIKSFKIEFPIAKDYRNVVADNFQALRTPEVFVLNQGLQIVYRGRIDDQYAPGVSRANPKSRDLQNALVALLAGKTVSQSATEATGCLIGRVKQSDGESDVTYCNQIARLFRKHCLECHREGEIGPFAMTDYEEIVGWADTIVEVVDEQRMPPWHANPKHGRFANERRMSENEKQLLRAWVKAGVPYGKPSDLPPEKKYIAGWELGKKPDLILAMDKRPFVAPAEGTVDYQYFVVDPGFKEDRWVKIAQILPGNRSVVHHSIVFIRPPDGADFRGVGYLTAYVPGQRLGPPIPGLARFVPAGSRFVFQQHYTPTGSEQTDMSKLGIVFMDDDEVTHEQFTRLGVDQDFEIPPHVDNFVVKSRLRGLPKTGVLLSIAPHMHLRGKAFTVFASYRDQKTILLDVPQYDFNWQHNYRPDPPIPVADIEAIEFKATFDNSESNPSNPDATQRVTWGDQTWEEMAVSFYNFSIPRQANNLSVAHREVQVTKPETPPDKAGKADKATQFVERYFDRFDKNKDGQIDREEIPLATRGFGFRKFDANRDSKLTRDEIRKAAEKRFK